MSRPRLALFGTPTLELEGTNEASPAPAPVALPFERRHQLAALLALERGWVTRARIAALLWPDQPTKLAYTNLRKTLFRLQALPWARSIEAPSAALRFDAETDVARFEAALAAGRVDEALALYRGELLAGFDDAANEAWTQWLRFERERLRVAWRAAALERAPMLDPAAAVALTARLLDADSLDEAALRAQMQALARDGQAVAARQAYRRFAEHLATELAIEPDAQSRALHEALSLAPDPLPSSPPFDKAQDRLFRGREQDNDGFVGRAVELQRIAELLARDECRLLCLVGPGGVGKTRLARRAIAALTDRFADGAWFIELEDAQTPAQAAQSLADALDVRAGADALSATTAALATRQALLVLDNAEQLADDAAALVEPILAAAPRVKLLVTSRERLPVALAWSMPLEGLPVPEPEDDDHAESFDAIRLFVQAARRVAPALSLTAERDAIVDICRQLEGLPLAIELAAAWTRVLSCADIADELRHGHELLRAHDAARPARHASIGVVFDESWRRLSGAERRALARLSVFRGGFTVEAARAVAGAALPVLGALVDKSLLRKDDARLALHPLLQQLAAARLDDEGDDARHAAEAAHADWFHQWLHRAWRASEQGHAQTLAAIETDFDNCRQAWATAIARGDGDALARSAPTLLNVIENRARFEDGLALWRQAIDALPPASPVLALLEAQAALIEFRLARIDAARSRATRALGSTSRTESDRDARWQALAVLAACALNTGHLDEARRLYLRVLALARARAMPHEIAATLENFALTVKRLGRYDESLRMHLEALAEHRRAGDGARLGLSLSNLASLEMLMGHHDAAHAHLNEALALAAQHGLTSTHAFVRANLVDLAMQRGDLAQAHDQATRALEIAHRAGMRALSGWLELQLVRLAARDGRVDEARARLADVCSVALELHSPALKAAALVALAEVFEALDRPGAARRVLAFGAAHEGFNAPDRDELRAHLARRAHEGHAERAWPGMSVDELLRRVVVERASALAGLVAELS